MILSVQFVTKTPLRMKILSCKKFVNTGQKIEDVHIFGGQTPVKRLENLNVCLENEFLSQVLNIKLARSNLIIQNLLEKFIFAAHI